MGSNFSCVSHFIQGKLVSITQPLSHYSILEFSGIDASKFCQAQLMNDVSTLSDGSHQWTGWLNPKGRVIALGLLYRHAHDCFWLLLPDYSASELRERMQRFVFRSKLTIRHREDLHVLGSMTGNAASSEWLAQCKLSDGRQLIVHAGVAAGDEDFEEQWQLADFRLGLPRLKQSQSEQWTPHMLSLDKLQAFSTKKGCYPGQEIVARTHFLGSSKRHLQAIEGQMLDIGQDIFPGSERERSMGSVISTDRTGNYGQAVLSMPMELGAATPTAAVRVLR
jgi:tRNA-modifying protein YgfZ